MINKPEPTPEELKERLASLPTDIQEAMNSKATSKAILEIAKTYRLQIDQTQDLAGCVGYLIAGFVRPQDFVDDLVSEVRIPPSLAVSVARDINQKILNPIKDRLRAAHEDIAKAPKKPTVGDSQVGFFEQQVKNSFNNQAGHTIIRPTIRPPGTNDPYREILD